MNTLLPTTLSLFGTYRYPILFPLAVVEGPVIMLLSGLMVRLGYLEWPLAFAVLFAGDLFADMVWYGVGYFGAATVTHRYGKFFHLDEGTIEKLTQQFHRHHVTVLTLSKMTMGLGFAVAILIVAGMAKVPLRTYATINVLGGLIWTGLLMTVGYFFGGAYLLVSGWLRVVFIVGLVLIVLAALTLLRRQMRKKFETDRL